MFGIKDRVLNPVDAYWDWRFGINTFGFYPAVGNPTEGRWRVHYTPTPYLDLFQLMRIANICQYDTFIDFGCGLGRAVFAAKSFGVVSSIGVDIVPSLIEQAETNLRKSKMSGIKFINMSADIFKGDATIAFMFHPFGPDTLRDVLNNCSAAKVIYLNPVYDDVFGEYKKFRRRISVKSSKYNASIWFER